MPEPKQNSGGIISRDDIVALAAWYDASEFALDPLAAAAIEAEKQFEARVVFLHDSVVRIHFPGLTLRDFRAGIRLQCRQFLQREKSRHRSSL